jgi:hypothetical protein
VIVSELVTLLGSFPADADVGVAAFVRSGRCVDAHALELATVETTRDDGGSALMVWMTGWRESEVSVPALVELPCACGAIVTFDPADLWPMEHDDH